MHYYIDGYNMLFRSSSPDPSLQYARESMIESMDKKLFLVKIHVSIVFDALNQPGEGSRNHFNHLEILFTPHRQTADDFIIKRLEESKNTEKETVVTNDKDLMRRARVRGAHTKTIDQFLSQLHHSYQKKLQIKKKTSPPFSSFFSASNGISNLDAPPIISENSYQDIFEQKWQVLKEGEEKKKQQQKLEKRNKKKVCPPRKSKEDPFPEESLHLPAHLSNEERWLTIFESKMLQEHKKIKKSS